MNVTPADLQTFQNIIEQYRHTTRLSPKDYWRNLDNNALWFWLVGQVMVAGGAAGNDRFQSREDLKQQIGFDVLGKYNSDKELQTAINNVLRAAGVRYASNKLDKCTKSKALVHNYRFISGYKDGCKGLLNDISKMENEQKRVEFLMQHLKFIKHKSARDFLMSMGINTNTLALDIRIQNIFRHLGIDFPTQAQLSNKAVYDKTEEEIIERICKPLNIQPAVFDRILYQNYAKIIGRKTEHL